MPEEPEMDTIDLHDLQRLLAADEPVRLVMALGPQRFAQAHIPGSEVLADLEPGSQQIDPEERIVVYCSGPACQASARAQRMLVGRGCRDVRRFVGGLEEWDTAGLPLGASPASGTVAA
jgi:rhodanese-related sulfurtransferase